MYRINEDPVREEDTAAWKLFHKEWPCSIPRAFTLNRKVVERFGSYGRCDRQYDEELAMEQVRTSCTIVKLATLLEQGCEPNMLKPEVNVPAIVAIIEEHIEDVVSAYNLESQSQVYVPTDEELEAIERAYSDLIKLKDLVEFLEEIPKAEVPVDYRPSTARSAIEQFIRFRRHVTEDDSGKPLYSNEPTKPTKRLSDVIKERANGRATRWL